MKIIWVLVSIQVAIIFWLILTIMQKNNQTRIDFIERESVVMGQSNNFKYFYEPLPNSDDPGTYFKNSKFSVKYTINNDSLNERFDYEEGKKDGVFRIITLGASFTQGVYVDTDKNWTEVLEDLLNKKNNCKEVNKFEVINLAYRGYDNDYVAERFLLRGIKYRPDLVIWLHAPFFAPVEQVQPLTKKYFAQESNFFDDYSQRSKKYIKAFNKASDEVIKKMGGWNKFIEYQKVAIARLANYYKGPLVLVSIPNLRKDEKQILEFLAFKTEGWKYYNGLEQFSILEGDGHPDVKGHASIARDMQEYLLNSGLLPC